MPVTLKLLGKPKLLVKDTWLEPRPSKPLALLFYAAHHEGWLARDKLSFFFWPDASESLGQQNLRKLIQRAKAQPFAEGLEVEKTRLRWDIATDVNLFRKAVAQQNWVGALESYSGPFLEGFTLKDSEGFEAWLDLERRDLERTWRSAAIKHVETLEAKEAFGEAASLLKQLLRSDQLAEDILQRYLRNSYIAGQREAALDVFDEFAKRLKDELDLEPLEATLELVQTIREARALEPSLSTDRAKIESTVPLTVLRPPRLIGRGKDIEKIQGAATPAVLIAGEAGIGKSRLMAELAPNALLLRCQEGLQNVPYYPVSLLIRSLLKRGVATPDLKHFADDLARLVPEVAPSLTPSPADPEAGRSRLFEALALYFEGVAPRAGAGEGISLLVDDLQWADEATLSFLIYLVNRKSLKLLGAYRVHEITDSLSKAIQSLSSSRVLTEIRLAPLPTQEVAELIASLMGVDEGPPLFSKWLYKGTGGNPMFMLETLKSLFEAGTLRSDDDAWETDIDEITKDYSELEIPGAVSDIIHRRVSQLSPQTQRVLQVASVVGEGFTPQLISQVSGLSEWAVFDGFDEAEAGNLIAGERFNHDVLRQSVYASLPETRKQLLHETIANLLTEADPGIVAEHWYASNNLGKATNQWLLAAANLQQRGLYEEAIALLTRAKEHAKVDKKWHIIERLANAYKDTAQHEKSVGLVTLVLENCSDPKVRAAALDTQAANLIFRGQLEQAGAALQEGFKLLEPIDDEVLKRRLRATAAMVKVYQAKHQDALELLLPDLAHFQKKPPGSELSFYLTDIAAIYDNLGRHEEALPLHEEALALAKRTGDKLKQVDASINLLYCLMDLGRSAEGLDMAEEALALGRYVGTDVLRNNLASAFVELGNSEKAIYHSELVTQDSHNPSILCITWARLALLYSPSDKATVHQAIEKSLHYAAQTELLIPWAAMIECTFKRGNADQRQRAQPFLDTLDQNALPRFMQERLELALAEDL